MVLIRSIYFSKLFNPFKTDIFFFFNNEYYNSMNKNFNIQCK